MPRTVVAITGASSGIGEVFARKLAYAHDLLLIARRADRLGALADELKLSDGCEVEVLPADLASESDQARVAERLGNESRLVLLVNNAGFGTKGRFWESPLPSQEAMHQVHVMATMRLTHAALASMVPRDMGGIINVASVSAFVRIAGTVSYAATKSWMIAFTEGLALELASVGSHVKVQALCPGFTYSDFHSTMGVERGKLAGGPMWLPAEYVVDQSLNGLRRGQLFVIPGWRYRLLTSIISKLPGSLRYAFERLAGGTRQARLNVGAGEPKSLP